MFAKLFHSQVVGSVSAWENVKCLHLQVQLPPKSIQINSEHIR